MQNDGENGVLITKRESEEGKQAKRRLTKIIRKMLQSKGNMQKKIWGKFQQKIECEKRDAIEILK